MKCERQKLSRKKKRIVLDKINGGHGACYGLLYKYGNILIQRNEGTVALINAERPSISVNPIFQRFFLCFPAQRTGYLEGCRPFIGLDGCHLKGPFDGVLLSAVALDANSGIFPIAVCVCEGENTDSWKCFLHLLKEQVGEETRRITFMSDRQKGIITALSDHFPNSLNRFCARHMYANFKCKYPGLKLRNQFWAAVRATQPIVFRQRMEEIKALSREAYNWLLDVPPFHWSRHAFDERAKNDHVANNIIKSFNSQLGVARQKSILSLLEHIRRKVMKSLRTRSKKGNNWRTEIPPRVQKTVDNNLVFSRHIDVIFA